MLLKKSKGNKYEPKEIELRTVGESQKSYILTQYILIGAKVLWGMKYGLTHWLCITNSRNMATVRSSNHILDNTHTTYKHFSKNLQDHAQRM